MENPTTNRLSCLLSSDAMSDVTLIVGKEERSFKLHKLLLSIHSDMLHAMFFGLMGETKSEINLPEDDIEAFEKMIRYMYTGKVSFDTVKCAISVYLISDKYLVKNLKRQCVDYLLKHINTEVAIRIYELATSTSESKLETAAWTYIRSHSSQIFQQSLFRDAQFSTVQKMLKDPEMVAQSEIQVYEAIVLWGKEQCWRENQEPTPSNVRQKIEGFLPEIRFLTMPAADFVQSPARDNILNESEQLNILKNIIIPGAAPLPFTCSANRKCRANSPSISFGPFPSKNMGESIFWKKDMKPSSDVNPPPSGKADTNKS